ncbi:unnamed protein product [Cuscuta campestris]|uniref:Uncharacterized protein n=1 Tax=Cuscuta campestris TaxID=132261 RepID=A0A484KQT4_9ASTE|nr:unnamed protein product [Cuscuta campestris]
MELTSAKNDFIQAHFPSAKEGKKFAAITYKMVVQCFLDICKGLDGEKKNERQEMEAVKMATLLFVVVVLLGLADRDKSAIPNWILGMIGQWSAILDFHLGTWAFMESLGSLKKDLAAKAKSIGSGASSTMYYTSFLLPIGALQSILVPDRFEATTEWFLNIHPLETTSHTELDEFVAKLEGRGDVHIPVERKRKAWNIPSPTRDNSVERNEHIFSSPQASQSLRESPSRVSHSNIPAPSSPTPYRTKPSSNSFQELFEQMSKKMDDIAEEQRKRFEVLAMTIMDDSKETEALNPSPFDKAESTHETMGTDAAASMKPLEPLVQEKHLDEYLYILRRCLCNDDGDSVIAPLEFTHYLGSYAHDPYWPVLSGSLEQIVDGTYSEGPEAFKTKFWDKNTKYMYYLKGTGTHWFCVKADFERGCLVVLNSLTRLSTIDDMRRNLGDDLVGFPGISSCREIGKHEFIQKPKWDFELCQVPQLVNSDCDIFAVKMLELGA